MDQQELAQPVLTATTCAICEENKQHHILSSCCKPNDPRGHEPVVCLECFQATVRVTEMRPIPCPMCRAPITIFRQFRTDALRDPNFTNRAFRQDGILHRVPPPAQANDEDSDEVTLLRVRNIRVSVPHAPAQPPPNTTLGIFRQQVLRRENIHVEDFPEFHAQLQEAHREYLRDAFKTFSTHRIYQRILMTMRVQSPPCALLIPELVAHSGRLAPNGLCISCFFPIGYHKRGGSNNQ